MFGLAAGPTELREELGQAQAELQETRGKLMHEQSNRVRVRAGAAYTAWLHSHEPSRAIMMGVRAIMRDSRAQASHALVPRAYPRPCVADGPLLTRSWLRC